MKTEVLIRALYLLIWSICKGTQNLLAGTPPWYTRLFGLESTLLVPNPLFDPLFHYIHIGSQHVYSIQCALSYIFLCTLMYDKIAHMYTHLYQWISTALVVGAVFCWYFNTYYLGVSHFRKRYLDILQIDLMSYFNSIFRIYCVINWITKVHKSHIIEFDWSL